jgi:adsorption protein B
MDNGKTLAPFLSETDDGWSDSEINMGGLLFGWCAIVMRETALFAACGFLLLGLSDFLVDLIWIRLRWARPHERRALAALSAARPGRLAIFVPAWDEAPVIGAMLSHALAAFGRADYRLYVGCYPNDPATVGAVRALTGERLRLVLGPVPGPTSKADCLNRLWERMIEDEAAEGMRFKAVILHDAEDVVHSAELDLFDALIERFDLVQIPVVALIDPASHWVSACYADEFAEAHGKDLIVREAIGAGLPAAGVGCAISRDALSLLAGNRGAPFDAGSLTEDYELGLRLKMLGRRGTFARVPAGADRRTIATRAYFPASFAGAVAQRARWITGIALAGWDRLGWAGGMAERWMRLRDRQPILSALLLCAAYLALLLYAVLVAAGAAGGTAVPPFSSVLTALATINSVLLLWRLAMRFGFVARLYGWREGARALPRVVIGNLIAIMAAKRAVGRYLRLRRIGIRPWDKTAHVFPRQIPAE